MADRTEQLRQAAQARHDATTRRARQTLDALRRDTQPITFRHLAKTAGVSRSWLYRQPDLRKEIEQLRQSPPAPATNARSSQRASTESLRQQQHIYRDEIARLRAENTALKDQLARQLGAARATSITKRS